ncbi:MAG: hypothetical protein A3C84_04400 [Candidatus Ryanbacteria bacterium RIFCSPHIGHO2_02_FULL_48_12]|uniref:ROK family protein n=1 Tax=Candidatus Ryanbacteria bacterium RIFCSPHIGHO2_01_FULL_48_27 TaxID=1802115 RepID=A0A1G2G657_9BACT|nr:MAG: hypothetical protein A2756_02400 [Candidatus Ryanbacteria bacterium RIFCSPHIGHO2_01_FULL_48_27]OGZ49821.1 MAG: hypothetical protein A3C84_04400 [Candidatus Ryanbacteria bacterium RIFCSPHIGHO2_02_FULL_48_12]
MYLLFDIGGTTTRIAISKDGRQFVEPKYVPTPASYREGLDALIATGKHFAGDKKIEGVSGGIAGPLDAAHTTLANSPHLPDWVDKPFKRDLEKAFRCPVYLENDAAFVGLGEATDGAGRGFGIVAYVTVSTGVGGVRIVDGKIDRNAYGFEIGHQIIDINGPLCATCAMPGHLEEYISGTSLERKYKMRPSDITDPDVWRESARVLSYGLNNVMVHWSPELIILGGAIMRKGPREFFQQTRDYFEQTVKIYPKLPRVERSVLGDIGGLHGALVHLNQSLEKYRT